MSQEKSSESTLKLLVDPSLPGVAKHLRMLGVDTAYEKTFTDGYMIYLARTENRIIVTRSSKLLLRLKQYEDRIKREKLDEKLPQWYWVKSVGRHQQIMEVVNHFKIVFDKKKLFSRCGKCNGEVELVDKILMKGKVYDNVYEENKYFSQCKKCNQIYWGTLEVKNNEFYRSLQFIGK